MLPRFRLSLSLLDMARARETPASDYDDAAHDDAHDAANDHDAVTRGTQTPVTRDREPRRWKTPGREQSAFDRVRHANPSIQET